MKKTKEHTLCQLLSVLQPFACEMAQYDLAVYIAPEDSPDSPYIKINYKKPKRKSRLKKAIDESLDELKKSGLYDESWIYENPTALKSLQEGIKEAKEGKLIDRPSNAEFANG
jgi:DNA-directed RNA polymerase subunit L